MERHDEESRALPEREIDPGRAGAAGASGGAADDAARARPAADASWDRGRLMAAAYRVSGCPV